MSSRLKYGIKWVVAQVLYGTGAMSLWLRLVCRDRAVVLTYHRVLSDADLASTWSHPGIVVSRRTFERHLQALRRTFTVITAAEFVSHIEGGRPFRGPACLITFDDGWRDTFTEAGPLLHRYGMPAVVFLPVQFIGSTEMFWQERLGRLLGLCLRRMRRDPALRSRLAAVLPPDLMVALETAGDDDSQRCRAEMRALVNALKSQPGQDPRRVCASLDGLLGDDDSGSVDRFMDWDQVRAMAAERVAFGGHSVTHRIMTTLAGEELDREVQDCRDALRRELGVEPVTFSYPNGDFDERTAAAVARGGFRVAFSTRPGTASATDDRFSIRRVNVHDDATRSVALFMARLAGVF